MDNQDWQAKVWDLTDEAERAVNKGKHDAAVKAYEKALALIPQPHASEPEALALVLNIAETYLLQQRYADALKYFLLSQTFDNGGRIYTRKRLGQIYLETGETDKARTELQAVYEEKGDSFFTAEGDEKYLAFLKQS